MYTSYHIRPKKEIEKKAKYIKEVKYKLIAKGLSSRLVDDYIYENKEEMLEYEINSAKSILTKKASTMEQEDIKNYLRKKGYMEESITIAGEDYE